VDLLSGHRQHDALDVAAAGKVARGVGEDQATSFREPEQQAQRGYDVVAPVPAQRLQVGVDIARGDLPQVAAGGRPAFDQWPDGAEVDTDGGV
jgi:hypothetical protein